MTWRWFDCMTNTYHDIKDEEEMTLTEQVFRKMGAELKIVPDRVHPFCNYWAWHLNNKQIAQEYARGKDEKPPHLANSLPPISSSWEVCAKWLVPFMEEAGFSWVTRKTLGWAATGSKMKYFVWDNTEQNTILEFVIVKNDIAEAACKAFMEVEL